MPESPNPTSLPKIEQEFAIEKTESNEAYLEYYSQLIGYDCSKTVLEKPEISEKIPGIVQEKSNGHKTGVYIYIVVVRRMRCRLTFVGRQLTLEMEDDFDTETETEDPDQVVSFFYCRQLVFVDILSTEFSLKVLVQIYQFTTRIFHQNPS